MKKSTSNFSAFFIGFLAFSLSEGTWFFARHFFNQYSKWVLEPSEGIVIAGSIIVSSSAWLGIRLNTTPFVAAPLLAYLGVCASLTLWLFVTGPGNLWPIVLFIDYVMVGPAVILGWGVGYLVALKSKRRKN